MRQRAGMTMVSIRSVPWRGVRMGVLFLCEGGVRAYLGTPLQYGENGERGEEEGEREHI